MCSMFCFNPDVFLVYTCAQILVWGLLVCFRKIFCRSTVQSSFCVQNQGTDSVSFSALRIQVWHAEYVCSNLQCMQIKVYEASCLHCYGHRTCGLGGLCWHSLGRNSSELLPIFCTASRFVNEDAVPGRGSALMGQKPTIWWRLSMQQKGRLGRQLGVEDLVWGDGWIYSLGLSFVQDWTS